MLTSNDFVTYDCLQYPSKNVTAGDAMLLNFEY